MVENGSNTQISGGQVIVPTDPAQGNAQIKKNVMIENTGNVEAYIRAAVVVNWMDNDGNVYGIKPNCSVTTNTGWTEVDGFFYYTSPVPSGNATTTAPATVGDPGAAPSSDYSLSIEIVAEAIQAEGTLDSNDSVTAVLDAWGLTPGGN